MLAVTINVLWLPLIVLCSAFFGYIFRKATVIKSQKRVLSLENEMLSNHAEILKLQQELATLERSRASQSTTPVVPMKDAGTDESQKNVR